MKWLIDTCVVSEIQRKQPAPGVLHWLTEHQAQAALSVVSVGEILHGIERLPLGTGRLRLQHWFDQLRVDYADRILPTDEAVWIAYARLRASVEAVGRSQDDLDLLIAATASIHGLTLVTRNTRHFTDTGIALVNPWKS